MLQICEESGTDIAQAVRKSKLKQRKETSQFVMASNVEQVFCFVSMFEDNSPFLFSIHSYICLYEDCYVGCISHPVVDACIFLSDLNR